MTLYKTSMELEILIFVALQNDEKSQMRCKAIRIYHYESETLKYHTILTKRHSCYKPPSLPCTGFEDYDTRFMWKFLSLSTKPGFNDGE